MLSKIWRILRKEGMAGLVARLRYSKDDKNTAALTPPFFLPLRLEGDKELLVDKVTVAITLLAGDGVIDPVQFKGCLYLSPTTHGPDFGPQDAILFDTPKAAMSFVSLDNEGNPKLTRAIANCAALLLPSPECLAAFKNAGVPQGKLFIVPISSDLKYGNVAPLSGALSRWLIAAGTLSAENINPDLFSTLRDLKAGSRICLSLPETLERRADFLRLGMNDFQLFDGIRKIPGWQGCGWSYATIAKAALGRNVNSLTICEDDMIPAHNFHERMSAVEAYLEKEDWDLFTGLLTDVPENCRIHRVERSGSQTFIHLDYSIGMVLNIYNRRALERLAAWRPENGDIENNTVDAWLAATPGLRVITTLPFLAGHNADAKSTIFGFANKRYNSMIQASEKRLERLVAQAEKSHRSNYS